jgi:hypothetical protein
MGRLDPVKPVTSTFYYCANKVWNHCDGTHKTAIGGNGEVGDIIATNWCLVEVLGMLTGISRGLARII